MSGNLGVNGFNSQALDSLRLSFGRLAADGHVKDGTIVKADRWTLSGVRSFKVVSGDYTGNLFRNADQVADNNTIRNAFLRSIANVYGGEDRIPESVRKALSAGIELCAKNRAANAKAGNHDAQPEFMMGSAELDAELQSRLQQINEETSRLRVASRGEEI